VRASAGEIVRVWKPLKSLAGQTVPRVIVQRGGLGDDRSLAVQLQVVRSVPCGSRQLALRKQGVHCCGSLTDAACYTHHSRDNLTCRRVNATTISSDVAVCVSAVNFSICLGSCILTWKRARWHSSKRFDTSRPIATSVIDNYRSLLSRLARPVLEYNRTLTRSSFGGPFKTAVIIDRANARRGSTFDLALTSCNSLAGSFKAQSGVEKRERTSRRRHRGTSPRGREEKRRKKKRKREHRARRSCNNGTDERTHAGTRTIVNLVNLSTRAARA